MSHFYGNMQGGRGECTRAGTKTSGMDAHVRGWQSGVRVEAHHNPVNERDEFRIYATSGSTGGRSDQYLGCVELVDGELSFRGEPVRTFPVLPGEPHSEFVQAMKEDQ